MHVHVKVEEITELVAAFRVVLLLYAFFMESPSWMVKGAVVEGAMSITRARHPKKLRREAGALLLALLEGLRVRAREE